MSDELAPIDLKSLQVLPFPIAVTLKAIPAVPFSPPALALKTRRALYVPVDRLPEAPVIDPTPIQAILFVSYSPAAPEPEVRELSAAEATARLYPNVLNALAHESMGLDQAIRLTGALPCYRLVSAGLEKTTEMVSELLASF
jgi:hypothetical protein